MKRVQSERREAARAESERREAFRALSFQNRHSSPRGAVERQEVCTTITVTPAPEGNGEEDVEEEGQVEGEVAGEAAGEVEGERDKHTVSEKPEQESQRQRLKRIVDSREEKGKPKLSSIVLGILKK